MAAELHPCSDAIVGSQVPQMRTRYKIVDAAEFDEFEWHEAKRAENWAVHEVDFEDAKAMFRQPHICAPSKRGTEGRWLAVGRLHETEITVVYTMREDRCRIISARRARSDERETYHQAIGYRSAKGKN
ncbi:BrnT family toxin [Methyloceanibacter sp.]|uniref:BrnT family toxin n=1 Tax=Methyloceanibacter sp. TaxID=1965321 RepID=UPI003D6CB19C